MHYVAVALNNGGGLIRHTETSEVKNVQLGEFDTPEQAIESACNTFNCEHVLNGVIIKGNHVGGHMVMNTQELSEL